MTARPTPALPRVSKEALGGESRIDFSPAEPDFPAHGATSPKVSEESAERGPFLLMKRVLPLLGFSGLSARRGWTLIRVIFAST